MLKHCIHYTQKSIMLRYFLIYIPLIIICSLSFAQAPDTLWTKTYGGMGDDLTESMHQVYDGGYFIAGWTSTYGAGCFDVYLIRTDSIGDTLWTKTYGGSHDDIAYASLPTTDSGFILVGSSGSQNNGNPDVYIIRTDSIGDTLWTKTYVSADTTYAYSICPANDSGFILVGDNTSGRATPDMYLMKINDTGDTMWTRTYGHMQGFDFGREVIQAHDSGYIVCGVTEISGWVGVWLMKIDEEGDTLWSKTFGNSWFNFAYSVQATSDYGYVIIGDINMGSDSDVYLIKVDSLGNELWYRSYGDSTYEYGMNVRQMDDNGYLIAGYGSFFNFWLDVYIIRTNSIGDTLWTAKYGGMGFDEACPITLTYDGGFAVAGLTSSFGAGGYDIWLLKFEQESQFINEHIVARTVQLRYPTVFSGLLRLPEDGTYKIYDITGRKVNIDKIRPGIYFIETEGRIVQKVIKIK